MHESWYWILCGRVSEANPPCPEAVVHRFSVHGSGCNVFVEYGALTELFWGQVNPRLLDLLSIAAYVYVADQATKRGAEKNDAYGDGWRRGLYFRIEVHDHEFWLQPEVGRGLTRLLSFLTDDVYHFEFVRSERTERWYPNDIELGYTGCALADFDEVMLFSGGLDSEAGAIYVAHVLQRSMVLVKHDSNPKYFEQHRDLAADLARRFGPRRSQYIPVRINKSSDLTVEPIQRSRSFLFGTLAVILAAYLNRPRILFFENGVVSVNLPLATQVVGARATRTTHPRTLALMSDFFSLVLERPLAVENPFALWTKKQVVELIAQYGYADMIRSTTSCAHPRLASRERPHCGVCSQCIDRRFAIVAAGLQHADPVGQYEVELIRGPRPNPRDQTMVAVYVETALQMTQWSQSEFFARYGEAARVLRYGTSDYDRNARDLFDLHQRHAQVIYTVVRAILTSNPDAILFKTFDPTSLLGLLMPGSVIVSLPDLRHHDPRSQAPYAFQCLGEGWWLRFADRQGFFLQSYRGLYYLRYLLRQPGIPCSSQDLLYHVVRDERVRQQASVAVITDKETYDAYRMRLTFLDAEYATAEAAQDTLRLVDIKDEQEFLKQQLASLSARYARTFSSPQEKIRKAVRKAVSDALDHIRVCDSCMADHFVTPILQSGHTWIYCPPERIMWVT